VTFGLNRNSKQNPAKIVLISSKLAQKVDKLTHEMEKYVDFLTI
jgi:hypothetical protein